MKGFSGEDLDFKIFSDIIAPKTSDLAKMIFLGLSANNNTKNALENERLGGSISSVIYALNQGVQIFRVHDVIETKQALDVYNKIKRA